MSANSLQRSSYLSSARRTPRRTDAAAAAASQRSPTRTPAAGERELWIWDWGNGRLGNMLIGLAQVGQRIWPSLERLYSPHPPISYRGWGFFGFVECVRDYACVGG
jgi:hypothetical protein